MLEQISEYSIPDFKEKRFKPGPWMEEPDRVLYKDTVTGYDCLIRRSAVGFLCGYVGVPRTHPAYGKHYDDESLCGVEVHGGLTYSEECDGEPLTGICHPAGSEENDVHWFGFDCGHCWDITPFHSGHTNYAELVNHYQSSEVPMSYKDIGYVKNEVIKLAGQLKCLETK